MGLSVGDVRGPGVGMVVLLCFLVSLLVSAGVHVVLREVLPPKGVSAAAAPAAQQQQQQQGEPVDVPSLMGVDVAQARGLLDPRGLLLTLDAEREDPAPAGAIVAQNPLAGSRAQRGSTVHATLSRGQTKTRIPDVAGQPADKATRALADLKLAVAGSDPEQSAGVAAGTVLGTTPPAGTEVVRGSEVRLRVSAGPGLVEVPKVTGLNIRKAKELLEGAKLLVTTRTGYDEETGGWVVLRQDPAAGARVAPGSTVSLLVNDGE